MARLDHAARRVWLASGLGSARGARVAPALGSRRTPVVVIIGRNVGHFSPCCCEDLSMTTLLYSHPTCLEHDPGRHHPESPARLRAALAALDGPDFARLERREAPEAALEDLFRVHSPRHVERTLGAVPRAGHVAIDADTVLSPASGAAALRAAGAV